METPWDTDLNACRQRQQRLLSEMQRLGVGLTVLTRAESIQWLTGARTGPLLCAVAAMNGDGHVTLVLPSRLIETAAAADAKLPYEAKRLSTMRDANDQASAAVSVLLDNFSPTAGRAACEFSSAPLLLTSAWSEQWIDFDAVLFALRRRKDPDELAIMGRANQANRAMYELARTSLAAGMNELDMYNALHTAAVKELGEPLTYFGQDFRCCARGGPPRNRECQQGELYILDLGVGFRGYYSDNARTLCVGGEPTDDQMTAWNRLNEVFELVQSSVCPGASCKQLYEQVREMLADLSPWAFNHHLGHGVGLAPHEGPHLNPNWDDNFQQGDFFTVEPGLYHEDLRAGIRLEQNYVVTETGVELLSDWPIGLC